MKKFTKYLKIVIGVLVGLVLVLAILAGGTGYWAYQHPKEAFQFVEKHFFPADLKITWQTVTFDSEYLGGLNFLVDLTVDGLSVQKGSPSLDLPFEHTRLRASIFPLKRQVRIHRAEAIAEKPLVFQAKADATPSPEKNPFQHIQDVIHILELIHNRVPIETFDAQAKKFIYRPSEGEPFTIQASLQQKEGRPLDVIGTFAIPGKAKTDIDINGQIAFDKIGTSEDFLITTVEFKGFGVDTTLNAKLNSTDGATLLRASGPILYRKDKLKLSFDPDLEARFTANEAKIQLTSGVRGIPGPLVKVDDVKITLDTPLETGETWSEKPSDFKITAPIELFFVDKSRRALMEKACGCKLPEVVAAKADGKVWLSSLMGETKKKSPVTEAAVSIESVQNKIFSVDLASKVKIDREGKIFTFDPHLNCAATIHSFQALKPMLDAYGILIPAPFDVLEGTLEFKADGPIATTEVGSQFPLFLGVNLSSSTQRMRIDTDANVQINPRFTEAHLDLKAKVASLYLDLPPLDPLDGLPRVAPDSRFMKAPPKPNLKPAKFKMSFNFEVETTDDGVIRLMSKYFKPYLPMSLKIQSDGKGENTGYIQSEPFDVTYLRRTVRVENLRIDLDGSDKGVFPLKGRISVKQTEYTVFIDVEGTTKNPSITMSSDPYLPKNEIVSVLLYDRRPDQLVSGDAETAGGVQAAIADRAIGLFGLWAFATTPIKSFSYNPVTKVYTATVAVSDDLTAGVGTDWEAAARLELRKRISRRWSLTAAWTPATQEESATSKLVLQWEKRF